MLVLCCCFCCWGCCVVSVVVVLSVVVVGVVVFVVGDVVLLVLVLCFSCSLLFVFVSDGCRETERQVDRGVDTDPPAGWNGSQGWGLTRSCSAPICILTKLISSSRVRKLVPETDQTT